MKIVIVGAGTSGWSVASLLSISEEFDITIIEPKDIPTIGVGESTIPYINFYHNNCRLPFYDQNWVNSVDGTLKFGILFDSYFDIEKDWFHPFVDGKGDYAVTNDALQSKDLLEQTTPKSFVFDEYYLGKKVANGYVPPVKDIIYSGLVAYHIDAKKYAELLKRFSLQRKNIMLNTDSVEDIVLRSDGSVEKLLMKNGEEIEADIFIDCTGFNSIFSNKMNNKWIGMQERLFVDNAIVVQLPHIDLKKQLHNYTYCKALDAGWSWHIPLQSRIGFGYNYSSKYITHEQAEKEFRTHLCDFYGYDPSQITFRRVPYCAGIREKGWNKNVISLGLSGFFLEPIEATAIATLHNLTSILFNLLTAKHIAWENKIERFNSVFEQCIASTAEYIELHYNLTSREDTSFWMDYKKMELSDSQKKILIGYADPNIEFNKEFVQSALPDFNLFNYLSYFFIFYGAGILPNCGLEKIEHYLYK